MLIVVVVIVAVVIGISLIVSLIISPPRLQTVPQSLPAVSTVIFTEDASLPDAPNNGIEPKLITVVVGVNNTVRWENHDTIPHGFPIPDDESLDPDFTKASQEAYGGYNGASSFIMPGKSFEYTFTHAAKIDYHMVPHPQMKGIVIVLPASGT